MPASIDERRPREGQELVAVQYRRLLHGAMTACARQASAEIPVEAIITHAGMSRRTFYDLFRDSEECFVAALNAGCAQLLDAMRIGYGGRPEQPWAGRVRAGLVEALALLDAQPDLAQLCVVYARGGGDEAVDVHQRFVGEVTSALQRSAKVDGPRDDVPDDLAAVLVGGIFALVQSHLSKAGSDASLLGLVGTVMYSVCMAYEGPESAGAQSRRKAGKPLNDWTRLRCDDLEPPSLRAEIVRPDLVERTLLYVVANPGTSNAELARFLGINIKAAARHLGWMADRGLLTAEKGPGTRNAWSITPAGSKLLRSGGASAGESS